MKRIIDLKTFRFGLILVILFYSLFGILDYFMLPENYISAWIIRFAIVIPINIISLLLTFIPEYRKYLNYSVFITLTTAQIGIMVMHLISVPSEPAFYSYYVGNILMLLSCEFIFQVSIKPATIYFLISLSAYLLIAVFDQEMISKASNIYNQQWLFGNLFFFISAGIISLLGLHIFHMNRNAAEKANMVKTSFLANISHEIRTPLNGITGCAKLISEEEPNEKSRKRYKEIIEFSSRQLLDIVDSILLMAEIETGKSEIFLEEISLKSLCYELIRHFKFMAEQKGLEFKCDCIITREQEFFVTDYQKLNMIMNNLLNNAIKFTTEGTITLRTGFTSEGFRIVIEDTGRGIEDEHIENIFESFYQSDKGYSREYGGNGLGLAICKSYITSLKGTIKVVSTPGIGSTFIVTLPFLPLNDLTK